MRRAILAIDPGKTTGLAFYDSDDQTITLGEGDFLDVCADIRDQAEAWERHLDMVAEKFLITVQTAKNTQATWSLELIGVARYMSQTYCGQDLIIQQQSSAQWFANDDRLKAMGWYSPGKTHANDAARHLLTYMVSRGWWDERLGPRDG